jgi:hypothetical protein
MATSAIRGGRTKNRDPLKITPVLHTCVTRVIFTHACVIFHGSEVFSRAPLAQGARVESIRFESSRGAPGARTPLRNSQSSTDPDRLLTDSRRFSLILVEVPDFPPRRRSCSAAAAIRVRQWHPDGTSGARHVGGRSDEKRPVRKSQV